MADDADRAADLADFNLRVALHNLRGGANRQGREAAAECEDCGGPIPQARRKAAPGCIRCVRCQDQFERDSKIWTR